MKRWLFLLVIFVSLNCNARGLRARVENGEVVFTNISKNLFFANAFRYSTVGKAKILKIIKEMAKKYNVDAKLVMAIAKIESDYNPRSVSPTGAKGIMQLMDKTAKEYGVNNPLNVKQNIKGGILFLKHLINKYHNVKLVAAAYNAGETAVDSYGGIPPYRETQRYVKKFLKAYSGSLYLRSTRRKHILKRKIVENNGVFTNLGNGLW